MTSLSGIYSVPLLGVACTLA